MSTYLAENSYIAIKPEATEGTAVVPTIFLPLVSENIKTTVNYNADRRMKGISWKANDLLRGNRQHEGDIVFLADPDTLGHLMNMVMVKGSTTGSAGDGYTHPYTVGNGKSYTVDIKKGLYVQRYFGVKAEELKLDFQDGQLQATLVIKAMGQFSVGSVGVALTGAGMTTLVLDDEYDISPNRGLVVGDVININGTSVTLLTVNSNGTTVTFASTAITASVGASVYLVAQTPSQATLYDPLYFGNLLIGFGADATAAATAAGSRSTATPVYDMSIVIKKNLFAQNGSNRMDPVQIIPRTDEAQLKLKQLFTGVSQRQAFYDRTKQALVLKFYGKYIKTDFSTQELFTVTFNNVKLMEHGNAITVGDMIVDEENFEVLYDNSDGVAMTASLVNRSAGTVY